MGSLGDRFKKFAGRTRYVVCRLFLHLYGQEVAPLIGDNLAAAIIKNREEQGLFKNIVDFKGRLSLDAQEISQLMHFFQF
jgi:hypothetical protein